MNFIGDQMVHGSNETTGRSLSLGNSQLYRAITNEKRKRRKGETPTTNSAKKDHRSVKPNFHKRPRLLRQVKKKD